MPGSVGGVKIKSLMADETLPVISRKEASESVNSDSYNYLQLTNRSTAPPYELKDCKSGRYNDEL